MHTCDPVSGENAFAASVVLFDAVVADLAAPQAAALTHDELEEQLADQGRELLRQLLQDHLDLRAMREEHRVISDRAGRAPVTGAVVGADGVVRRAVETGHTRLLATIFGRVTVTRLAYRATGPHRAAANLYPADAVLNLPERMHSHALARRAAAEAVRGSFDDAHASITAACGNVAGKRQLERLTVDAAADIDAFYAAGCPAPATDSTLLVLSVDGKGVVMRPEALREPTRKAAATKIRTFATRLAGGEKPARKRIATLGVVYDAEPAVRAPDEVITPATSTSTDPPGRPPHPKGPTASGKWLTGSITDTSEQVIAEVFDQAEQRDPAHRRPWIMLVDGARHQLDLITDQAMRRGVALHIVVDLIHVLEYVWKAAWSLHPPADPAAEQWVAAHALEILAGRSGKVADTIDAQATAAGLTPDQRKGADTCTAYLRSKHQYLHYDVALAAGWPIATGVIEGACRHLIGDRLDITGARWGLDGAEAILKLRALNTNGDFPDYWTWHLQREHQRVHQTRYQNDLALAA